MMARKRVEWGQWVGQIRSLYCPFLTPLISWHWGWRKEMRLEEYEDKEVPGRQKMGERIGWGRSGETGELRRWRRWLQRSHATDGEERGEVSIRQQWEWCRAIRPATVSADLTQKHTVWWKLTHCRTHFNTAKQMLSRAGRNALRCYMHQSPNTLIMNVPADIMNTYKCLVESLH